MATTNAFDPPRAYNGDRMLGAAVLSLALGIWITLVQQGLSTAPSPSGKADPAVRSAVAAETQISSLSR
jgi:hypothetical protein